ncbi:nitroreductase family protein [Gulosibacter molinativorax]|uniref:nitroreductase family protein n=1 Tax=Gulosibacter molinativorax TaxID=256821 RepID=UPI000410563C|nr:nitroreductase family protein [Gulosibacter molinativorax]QUY63019.1 Oxygen-insensitive NAD(P)H nitroreductase [Gulosibacter molinativorax]
MTIIAPRNATTAPIADVLENRWSPRGFDSSHEVSEAEIRSLIEAARWSPSAFNSQPWGFIVGRRGSDNFNKIFSALVPFNQEWNVNVSALIVALARVEIDGKKLPTAYYDLGQAAAHLTVQAETLGLNVHQMGGFDPAAVAEQFVLPEGYEPYTVIAVGQHSTDESIDDKIRERDAAPRERNDVSEILLSFE